MEKNNIIISEGNRPLWQRIIAALIYTCIIIFLIMFFTDYRFTTNAVHIKNSFSLLEMALILLPTALGFSVVRDWHFDLSKKKYKIVYCIGPLQFGSWNTLPEIDYVSVFKQPKANGEYIYETNLWYNKNKHFNILESEGIEPVFEMGKNVSTILKVKLLDATVPNAYKWVDV